jgi:hypothetical protein
VAAPTPAIEEKDLRRWRLVEKFRQALDQASAVHPPLPTWEDERRRASQADYLSLFLFGLFNPTLKTMRAVCAASGLERVQKEVCGSRMSLGSFSEAQAVVDPALLQEVFASLLTEEAPAPRDGAAPLDQYRKRMLVMDSSLWHVLPRMVWAFWRDQSIRQNAVRLHVKFKILTGHVEQMQLRAATTCERKQWKEWAQEGEFYVGDRNYGEDYNLLRWMDRHQSQYLVRLRQDAQWVEEQALPLTPADAQAQVWWHGWVRLGKNGDGPRVRLVRVLGQEEQLLLVTNTPVGELSAELISALYRYRWQVELFFRWFKHIFGCRHWMAESQAGVALQVYLGLIAGQLMLLYRGALPNKRQFELIQLYLSGWATLEELMAGLERLAPRAKRKS